tara:strand:+ start:7006 stop:7992 length:987 start_codon:yes stop_codon:yes gene_type:complete
MFKIINESYPNILSVTDILIGDMSDINYEFLLVDKPIILISNAWLDKNFPDLGERISNIKQLHKTLLKIQNIDNFVKNRDFYKKKAFFIYNNTNSKETLRKIIEFSNIDNPIISLHHNNNQIYKSNLLPLKKAAENMHLEVYENFSNSLPNIIHIAAHFAVLKNPSISNDFCVHLDHGLKGDGTANVEISLADYKKNNFFPNVDLHITAGPMGFERTKKLLGTNSDRAIQGAYPKADYIINGNNNNNRYSICKRYNLDPNLPIITYASAGEESLEKPGGSLSKEIIAELRNIHKLGGYNVVVKLKYKHYFIRRAFSKMKTKLKKLFPY